MIEKMGGQVRDMLAEWSEELIIDHGEIDRDHKAIFETIRELYQTGSDQASFVRIGEVFRNSLIFLAFHFSREEVIMAELDYPEAEEHIKAHSQMLTQYGGLNHRGDVNSQEERRQVMIALSEMMIDHINAYDRPLARFCREEE